MQRKTIKRLIGLVLIFAGAIGGYLSFQSGIGMFEIIIIGIILLAGFVLAGGGMSDTWISSD